MSVKAFLDSYELIRVEVKKYFYNGDCHNFYVEDENKSLKALRIINKVFLDDIVVYEVEAFNNLQIGKNYTICDDHAYRCVLNYRHIVRTPRFEEEYYYDANDLGITYSEEATTFKVWAPTATTIYLNNIDDATFIPMAKKAKGVWEITLKGDYLNLRYLYHVFVNGVYLDSTDPYAVATLPNQSASVVLDPLKIGTLVEDKKIIKPCDAIIYEMSVRDFTSKLAVDNRSTFKAFIKEGLKTNQTKEAGFDYLKTLDVTHIQLMPIYDFYTVNDNDVFKFYNWGYDPIQYNVLKPAFSTNPQDPQTTIREFKELVNTIHQNGMLVTMDVVYNHMYDRNMSAFERLVPYYFFRMNQDGVYSNGSYCGNDFESALKMGRKYIVDSIKMWERVYGIDGFRFDLMGIIDIPTMKEICKELHEINPYILIYGEGWEMPTFLDNTMKSSLYQAHQLPQVAFFNDSFRDLVKGKTSEYDAMNQGYGSGNNNLVFEIKNVLVGNTRNNNLLSALQSVNYCECHDNATVMDKLRMCLPHEDYYTLKKRAKFIMGMVLTSFGIPFIHCGQEFGREKEMLHNTYNASDDINGIDWDLKDQNLDMVIYTQKFIKLRKKLRTLHLTNYEEINKRVMFEVYKDNMLKLVLLENSSKYHRVEIYYNPNQMSYDLSVSGTYDILYSEGNNLQIQPISIMVIGLKKE